ncbi:pitrilysin family protein [Paenibacillus sp.]|uniref:M16 family metallopeptidase n=1 Tax=Paenibacillus sp. TaxID=58172 RepID=UPI002D4497C1|nr:pitrilysin family protein [Paenibacillus sp.]HZG86761.1 pitrilysin family protein [Paenibacillus sp.]
MERRQLSNGIRVVLENMPTSRSVSFGIWVKTGSRNEAGPSNGISHFIEHMMFKGTERYSAKDIADVFDGIGGNVNAFTSKEYTCYYAKVLDEHVPIAVDVLADMFFRSTLAEEELTKEKNVIIEEISMYEDTPDDIVHDLIAKAAYGDHPLGLPILGTAANLAAMTASDLRRYIETHYGSDTIVISAAGNIGESTLELFEKHFGSGAQAPRPSAAEAVQPPAFAGGHHYLRKKTEQNHICIAMPGCSQDDPLLYAMILLNNAIGGGMSSRLFQEVREKRGLAYSIYSYHTSHIDSGLFTVYAGTTPKQTAEVLDLIYDVLADVREHGITPEELRKGKEQMKGSLIIGLESTSSRMTRNGKNELMLGRLYTLDELIERIDSVTMDDVMSLAGRLFGGMCATAMVGGTDKALVKWRDRYAAAIPH